MADIEKENDAAATAKDRDEERAETQESSSRKNAKRPSVRDLVASAGAAFDILNDEVTPVETAETVEAVEADAPASEEVTPRASKKKKRGGKKKSETDDQTEAVASVDWNEETKNLQFDETSASLDSTSTLEDLARRVADTVSKNEEADSEDTLRAEAQETVDAIVEEEARSIEEEMHSLHEPEMKLDSPVSEHPGLDEAASADTEAEIRAEAFAFHEAMVDGEVDRAVEEETSAQGEPMAQTSLDDLEEKLDKAEDDSDPQATEFVDSDQLMSIIESMLFSTDKPVSVATIKQLFKGSNIRSKDISRTLDLLASTYASPTRGVSLEEVNGGYQLRTKSDNADFLKRLAKVRPFRLSGPALEVMSIVAYKQPVTKHEIDEIRGVESGHLLRALMERGLVAFGEKSDLPGKPMTYNSTRKFLEIFGLRNIRELPTLSEIDELLPEGIGEVEEKETLSDITESLSTEFSGSYSEGEEELTKINEQLQAVDTTSEFFEQEKVRERERRDRERAQDIREKIVLGDEVEKSDRRWLDRYEAKLAAPAATEVVAAEAAPLVEEGSGEGFSEQLEALTEESQPQETADYETEEVATAVDDTEEPEDLSALTDYDDDEKSDEESEHS